MYPRVEYESLPNMCFSCGCYRHLKDMYNFKSGQEGQKDEGTLPSVDCGNLYYANNKFNDYARSQIDWIAQYNSECSYTGNYSLWQFTSSATLDGIKGYVDMSYLH